MEFRSNLKSFVVYSILIFLSITIIGYLFKEFTVYLAYIGLIFFWVITKIESHDFIIDKEKITIKNRLKINKITGCFSYQNLKEIKIINYKHTRHPYQRLEILNMDGHRYKYAFSGMTEEKIQEMISLIKRNDLMIEYIKD